MRHERTRNHSGGLSDTGVVALSMTGGSDNDNNFVPDGMTISGSGGKVTINVDTSVLKDPDGLRFTLGGAEGTYYTTDTLVVKLSSDTNTAYSFGSIGGDALKITQASVVGDYTIGGNTIGASKSNELPATDPWVTTGYDIESLLGYDNPDTEGSGEFGEILEIKPLATTTDTFDASELLTGVGKTDKTISALALSAARKKGRQ